MNCLRYAILLNLVLIKSAIIKFAEFSVSIILLGLRYVLHIITYTHTYNNYAQNSLHYLFRISLNLSPLQCSCIIQYVKEPITFNIHLTATERFSPNA